ncbi:TIGR02530 family flagellar biosynthesis protein [Helicovermis profundi]|uniref:Flagellar operon protein n=1 Tax=Helicovermis profundi TaxID=3065157 RepID=A0AAU9EIH1_9FIRM|nr:hypothetical protein HLPR_17040 [Clostridia bacterium S502]
MNNKLNINNNDYIAIKKRINDTNSRSNTIRSNTSSSTSFNDVLKKIEENSNVKFSKHATSRLRSRNISLSENDIKKLNSAVSKAKSKGINDALILMDNKIFIANVKNKTIVTASTENEIKDNVFTNIDGAVIV